jgi:ribonuclease P/MRP protein subunit RPP40
LDARKQIDVIYIDFSKAFDRVDHKLLLTKLDSFGFSDNLIQLIASYLSDRALFVQYRGFSSGLFQQLSGVPQGSVLGPLFFVIFSNDMTDLLNVPFQLYADDLKIYNVIETNEDCLKLQRNIDLIQNWARTNNLLLNINKCNVVS